MSHASAESALADLVARLQAAQRVLVVAGAGISVSCGIPDFRSPDGIYALVAQMQLALPAPECLFHIDYFRHDPEPFFRVIRHVLRDAPAPSPTHRFLKLLQDQHKLLRVYTQNVDGLEHAAGVTRYVACHGSMTWSTCMQCQQRVLTDTLLPVLRQGEIPRCAAPECRGVLKPDVTFFGEMLTDEFEATFQQDRTMADLVLVIGTSLNVSPVAEIPSEMPPQVPLVVLNKTPLESHGRLYDLQVLGECDAIVRMLCDCAGWTLPNDQGHVETETSAPSVTVHKQRRRICVGTCQCTE